MSLSFSLSEEDKQYLSRLARQSIQSAFDKTPAAAPAPFDAAVNGSLRRNLGSFVTLSINHRLRGCIGTIMGSEPLYANVWRMARAAAFEDRRFPPLAPEEWAKADVAISVLDELTPCSAPDAVEVGRHGLVLQYGGRGGVFLPQVPVEQGWDRLTYLDQLCLKAGLPPGTWRKQEARLFWYEALVFPA
ncbi:MAG: AmmeMemoRadiSam system protein A [Desulfovibrio sp.]|jgi:AmmeMemoRadiSam system protein A|nr:AmmeMemoRadiSam system protein A [Desulfovibrio sp.]